MNIKLGQIINEVVEENRSDFSADEALRHLYSNLLPNDMKFIYKDLDGNQVETSRDMAAKFIEAMAQQDPDATYSFEKVMPSEPFSVPVFRITVKQFFTMENQQPINEAFLSREDLNLFLKDLIPYKGKIYISPKFAQSLGDPLFNRGPSSYERTRFSPDQPKSVYIKVPGDFRTMLRKGLKGALTTNLPVKNSDGTYKWILLNLPENEFTVNVTPEGINISKVQPGEEKTGGLDLEDMFFEDLDPVGKEDADVNNDGKIDSTDQYLMNRRKKIAAARSKKKKGLDENMGNYMFFQNLKTIKQAVDTLLEIDEQMIDDILSNGHDWAEDHIATSKDDIEEVYNFFASKFMAIHELNEYTKRRFKHRAGIIE